MYEVGGWSKECGRVGVLVRLMRTRLLRRVLFGVPGTSASVRELLKLHHPSMAFLQTAPLQSHHEAIGKITPEAPGALSVFSDSQGVGEAPSDQQWLFSCLGRSARSCEFQQARRRARDDHLHPW